jgi:rhodanese-related sulfurtransferase
MIASRDYRANPHSYTVVDVRSTEEHLASHLFESLYIPLAELDERWTEVPTHQPIAVVCGNGGGRSIEGAQILAGQGLHADWLEGGTLGNL